MRRVVSVLMLAFFGAALWGTVSIGQAQQVESVRVDDKTITIRKNSLNWVEVLGEVVNGSGSVIGFVEVAITLKGASNKVIDVGSTYVNGKTVSVGSSLTDTGIFPGERASFSDSFSQTKLDSVKSVEYVVTYRLAGPRADIPDSTTTKTLSQMAARLNNTEGLTRTLSTKADSLSIAVSLHTASIMTLGKSVITLGVELDSLKTRPIASSKLLGDLNNDGAVNFDDFFIFAENFGKRL